ncbi:MAG: HAMP domain-containing histidine kinase [Gemmatimonadaceae bacterium]|nr:HAMP domain-containing histidine kinase [Gemmatimonadaceae bacterium]
MPTTRLAPLTSRGTLLGVLLAATLGLGGVFAMQAVGMTRSHNVSVGRFLDESAQAAAREFLSRSRDEVDALGADLLSGITGQRATSPYEELPAIESLQRAAERTFVCADSGVRAFRFDFRGRMLVTGSPSADAERMVLASRIANDYRERYRPEWRTTLLVAGGGTRPVLYGVRFAEFRAPLAVYGVELCDAALQTTIFRTALARGGLLATDAGGLSQDSLLAVSVQDASGAALLTGASDSGATHRASATIERLSGVIATVTLRPAAARLLAVSPPSSSRVELLVGLFVLTALLSLLALLQLRREAALVRLRTDFTSSVSHELRTPLAQILLFGETLRLGRARTEKDRQFAVDTIVEEGRRLMHLVDNLLQFDRSSRGATPLALTTVPVSEVVTSACDTFAPIADVSRMTLTCDVPLDLAVRADAAALRHVLLNFLDNAAKYGPSPQQVHIAAARSNGIVRISVDDQGPGVPESERESIWPPFARLDRDRRGARPGSGIGLSVVRDLVTRQQGRCSVEGAPGGGARFVVELASASVN